METAKQKRSVDTHKVEKGTWDRMPMPRPLNSSIVINSLEVRTIFSLFDLKKHMLGFERRHGRVVRAPGCGAEGRRFESRSGQKTGKLTVHPAANGYLINFGAG